MGSQQHSSRMIVSQAVAIGAASVASIAFGNQTYQVRLCATSACYYLVTEASEGTTVAVSASNGAYLPANWVEYVTVSPGQKITVIEASAAGSLTITELTT